MNADFSYQSALSASTPASAHTAPVDDDFVAPIFPDIATISLEALQAFCDDLITQARLDFAAFFPEEELLFDTQSTSTSWEQTLQEALDPQDELFPALSLSPAFQPSPAPEAEPLCAPSSLLSWSPPTSTFTPPTPHAPLTNVGVWAQDAHNGYSPTSYIDSYTSSPAPSSTYTSTPSPLLSPPASSPWPAVQAPLANTDMWAHYDGYSPASYPDSYTSSPTPSLSYTSAYAFLPSSSSTGSWSDGILTPPTSPPLPLSGWEHGSPPMSMSSPGMPAFGMSGFEVFNHIGNDTYPQDGHYAMTTHRLAAQPKQADLRHKEVGSNVYKSGPPYAQHQLCPDNGVQSSARHAATGQRGVPSSAQGSMDATRARGTKRARTDPDASAERATKRNRRVGASDVGHGDRTVAGVASRAPAPPTSAGPVLETERHILPGHPDHGKVFTAPNKVWNLNSGKSYTKKDKRHKSKIGKTKEAPELPPPKAFLFATDRYA